MKSESDSKICPPELAVFIRDYHGVPSAARVLKRNEYLLKETPPEKLREVLERFYKEEVDRLNVFRLSRKRVSRCHRWRD